MFLTDAGIQNRKAFEDKGYELPTFDRKEVKDYTQTNPEWIHFGAGNIFRAFQVNLMDKLITKGSVKSGLIVCEGYDYEIVEKMYAPHDDLTILVTLKADGQIEKKVLGGIAASYVLDRDNDVHMNELKKIFAAKSLKMVSFTITEKGYVVQNAEGKLLDQVSQDIEAGPENAAGYIGKVASLLHYRYISGAYPIAMVSMDNCSHNGDKLKNAILTFAKEWNKNGKCDAGFVEYVSDVNKVSFPWSMIDKITPRPDEKVAAILGQDGIDDLEQVVTSKNTYVAPFVNAEETEYLVIEDAFPAGKLPLEEVGVIYTDRETVDKTEKMKVCTCLNPLHTAMAIFGCLLGHTSIHEEMDDEDIKKLVYGLGYDEGMKVVVDPKVLAPADFIEAVLTKRLPNPFMPDTPQRIACDTSQKLPIRFGETIKAYRASDELSTDSLKLVPLVLAGWLRYLQGIDDRGKEFTLSPDPMLDKLKDKSANEILHMEEIFGTDLFVDNLGTRILEIYERLCEGNGKVRAILHEFVG